VNRHSVDPPGAATFLVWLRHGYSFSRFSIS